MFDVLGQLDHWHWFGLVLVLLIFELFGAGAYLLLVGFAAAVVGLLKFFIPDLDWQWQLFLFGVGSIVVTFSWWKYQKKRPRKSDEPTLNRRTSGYIGRMFTLSEPIVNGKGKVHIDDSMWRVSGDDMPIGTKVKVTHVDDMILFVDKVIHD